LSVDVEEIDQQHKKLIVMINDLSDAMVEGKGKHVAGGIIDDLIEDTASYFKTEEKYFDQFGYPDAEAHKKEHVAFVQKVSQFKDGFDQGKIALSVDIISFLYKWLQNHIKKVDKQYSQFFNDKGLT